MENRARCRPLAAEDHPKLAPTTLLAKPLRHAPLDLFLINELAAFRCFEAAPDRFLNVDVVMNIFERDFLGQNVEQFANFLFRTFHRFILT